MHVVYFNEFNVSMGKMRYLPLVSGLLRAFAETSDVIRSNYRFMPFISFIDAPDSIMARYSEEPDVAAFSVSMWNEQLNLRIAAEVKARWPNCLVVFGGAQVPHDPTIYMTEHPFIDVACRAEGEEPFHDLLLRFLESRDFDGIPGITYRRSDDNKIVVVDKHREFSRDLDSYPSPYLEGLYDELLSERGDDVDFQAIIETNRGCPFQCTFCYWGRGGLSRKYRYHDMDRVLAEIDWCGRNGIRYVFNADSNFGMHKRDAEIADFIVETKRKYGFPEKFRTCFGKNTDENIFRIGSLFHRNELEKGITLARQTNDKNTLKNIKRGNIKMSTYVNLQQRFNDENIPIYSELILGLPGETVDTWMSGVDELLESGLKNQLFIYLCQVFNGTEMADPEYQRKFGIKTKRIALNEIHGSLRPASLVTEYEDVIIETSSMSVADWRRMVLFSWVAMGLHSMKMAYYVLIHLRDQYGVKASDLVQYISDMKMPANLGDIWRETVAGYNSILDSMLNEHRGRGVMMPEYGPIYWDVEEASLLRFSENWDSFYEEFGQVVVAFLEDRGIRPDTTMLEEVMRYQRSRMPSAKPSGLTDLAFTRNWPEYFETRFDTRRTPLVNIPQTMKLFPVDYGADALRFARETVLWGRKSGTMLIKAQYDSIDGKEASELLSVAS